MQQEKRQIGKYLIRFESAYCVPLIQFTVVCANYMYFFLGGTKDQQLASHSNRNKC